MFRRNKVLALARMGLIRFNQEPGDGGGGNTPKPADPTPKPADPTQPEPEKGTDWKAEARKWEDRAKENKTAAEKLAALEESQKTEDQKKADRMAELESKVKGYETRDQVKSWAEEIVKDSDISTEVLRGSTREELEKHFEQIKSTMPKEPEPKKGAVAPYVQSEGTSPSDSAKDTPTSRGTGTLRHAYATEVTTK
jgi:gas vesicle protein